LAIEAGKKFAGFAMGTDQIDPELTVLVDVKFFEAKRMFHPWNRQAPELFASCIITTFESLDFPTRWLQQVWKS